MNLGSLLGITGAKTGEPATKQLRDLKKACEQFEAVFAKQLLSEMRKGTEQTSMGDQAGSAIYKDMMDQTIADSVAHQNGLGIAKMLYKEFASQVEASSAAKRGTSAPAVTVTHEN